MATVGLAPAALGRHLRKTKSQIRGSLDVARVDSSVDMNV